VRHAIIDIVSPCIVPGDGSRLVAAGVQLISQCCSVLKNGKYTMYVVRVSRGFQPFWLE
jgi:hypothetical protein